MKIVPIRGEIRVGSPWPLVALLLGISLEAFDWGQYLKSQQAVAAPKRLFSKAREL